MSGAEDSRTPTRILLIEDSNTDALLIRSHLKKADAAFDLRREERLDTGLAHLDRGDTDVVLLDLNLPDSSGLDTFRSVHRQAMHLPIVILSGQEDVQLAVDAVALGAQDYLPKGEVSRSSLSRSIRYAIERSRRQKAEQELTAAGEIQRRLFPQSPPQVTGYDLYGRCEPANLAGGDYFDFFPMGNGGLGVVVADVSGHGIGPALIMSETRAILRTLATTYEGVGDILTRANQVLAEDLHNNVFVALLLIHLAPQRQTIQFASAGMPGVLLSQDGQIRERICSPDPPLGIIEGRQFSTEGEVILQDGDTLLLYTDGIVEMFNEQEEQFGEHRLIDTVSQCAQESSRRTIEEIFHRVHEFASEDAYQDDMTAVIVKVRSQTSDESHAAGPSSP